MVLHSEFPETAVKASSASTTELTPFKEETDEVKAKCIISWILGYKFEREVLNTSQLLPNILVSDSLEKLKESRNQSNLRRIVDAKLDPIEKLLEPNTYKILLKLQKKYRQAANLKYACMECNVVLVSTAWCCDRCLLWNHKNCKTIYPREPSRKHKFCGDCYMEA